MSSPTRFCVTSEDYQEYMSSIRKRPTQTYYESLVAMDAAYSEEDNASSMSDPDEDHDLPPAVEAAYDLQLYYEHEAIRYWEYATSRIQDGTLTDETPVLPINGEYLLYSPEYFQYHHEKFPALWTDQFASTWTAGKAYFGNNWGGDGDLGCECAIPGLEHPLTFGYREAVDRTCQGELKWVNGVMKSRNEGTKGIHLWFLEAPYMVITIPAEQLCGLAKKDNHYVFFGILDRMEEEMANTGYVPDYKRPTYSAPYINVVPQIRDRYLVPTSRGGEEPSTPDTPKMPDETVPSTVCSPHEPPKHASGHTQTVTSYKTSPPTWNDYIDYLKILKRHQLTNASCFRFERNVRQWALDGKEMPIESLEGEWTLYSPGFMACQESWMGRDRDYTVGTMCFGMHEKSDDYGKHYPLATQLYMYGLGNCWWITPHVPHVASGKEGENSECLVDEERRNKLVFFVTFLTQGVMKLRFPRPSGSDLGDTIFWAVHEMAEERILISIIDHLS